MPSSKSGKKRSKPEVSESASVKAKCAMNDAGNIILSISGLTKRYGGMVVADVPKLDLRSGEFVTIVGPSGSGKSTLLGMLTGTIEPTSGEVRIRGKAVTDLPPERRPTAMVFQSLALFPHMTVGKNIEFPLEVKRVPKPERKKRALELMRQLRLPADFYGKGVSQCSGGERQRVAIARALAYDPEILFFDEPLSAIDYRLRKTLEVELMDIHQETGKTFVYVTHSLEEAMIMSDRIAIMRNGKIVQLADAQTIYSAPANKFVADFLGEINAFDCHIQSVNGKTVQLSCPDVSGSLRAPARPGLERGQSLCLIVRPENMSILGDADRCDNVVEVTVEHELMLGSRMQYHTRLGTRKVIVERLSEVGGLLPAIAPREGDRVRLGWNSDGGILVAE